MKKLFLLILTFVSGISATVPTTYTVDVKASYLIWTGYQVTGQHTGTIRLSSGTLVLNDGQLTGGSFDVNMSSIRCTDLDAEWASKLVDLLKSGDFFSTTKFPISKFVITKVTPLDKKGNYLVVGNLTLKGITQEVEGSVNLLEANGKINASGKMSVDRTRFNIRYGSSKFFENLGDKAIGDNFDLAITILASK